MIKVRPIQCSPSYATTFGGMVILVAEKGWPLVRGTFYPVLKGLFSNIVTAYEAESGRLYKGGGTVSSGNNY